MAIYSDSQTAPAAFAAITAPTFTFPFRSKSVIVVNEDTTLANYVEVSFDGINVHGRLIPTVIAGLKFDQSVNGLWVRRGAGTPVVRVVVEQ